MRRFVEEADRGQWTLLPECLDDFIDESNSPFALIDSRLSTRSIWRRSSFEGVEPAATGSGIRPPSVSSPEAHLQNGYLNRVQSRAGGSNEKPGAMWSCGCCRGHVARSRSRRRIARASARTIGGLPGATQRVCARYARSAVRAGPSPAVRRGLLRDGEQVQSHRWQGKNTTPWARGTRRSARAKVARRGAI